MSRTPDPSADAIERRRRADAVAATSLRLAGFTQDLGPVHAALTEQWIQGEIDTDEAIAVFLASEGVTEPEQP